MKSSRNKQINKEALITLAMYIAFFAWWYITAYGLGSGNPEEYTYILGLPSWFFYSCVVGYIGISITVAVVVKKFFKDVPFEDEAEETSDEQ